MIDQVESSARIALDRERMEADKADRVAERVERRADRDSERVERQAQALRQDKIMEALLGFLSNAQK